MCTWTTILYHSHLWIPLQLKASLQLALQKSDRIEKASLKDVKNSDRGAFCSLEKNKGNVTLIRWNDNSQVTFVTNIKKMIRLFLLAYASVGRG